MKRNINYEWDIEEHAVDYNGECLDVLDHYHSKKCPSLYQLNQLDKIYPASDDDYYFKAHGIKLRKEQLVLVRDVWIDEGEGVFDLDDRSWAYSDNKDEEGKWILPEHFDSGAKVPKRFHEELRKVQS